MRAFVHTLGRALTHLRAFASPTEHRECGDYATGRGAMDVADVLTSREPVTGRVDST